MVKIKAKLLFLGIVMLVIVSGIAHAARSRLIISDVDVKVGSKTSKNLVDGDKINEEAQPGDTIEVRVEVKNNFTSSENLDINDITIKTTIEEIDDGDDLDEE